MATSMPHTRKAEVVRTVLLSRTNSVPHCRSVTPTRQQTATWSGPLKQLFGYELEEAESTEEWWLDRVHRDDVARIKDSLSRHLLPSVGNPNAAESRIWGADYRFRHADGTFVMVSDRSITTRDERGHVLSFASVVFDKEKRRLERGENKRNQKSQDHLAIVANNTPSGIFMMDPAGYCTFMNAAAEQITGFKYEEIYDYTFHASVHSCFPNGEPYPLKDCPVFTHQQEGTAAKNETEVFVHKDGHFYDIVYSVSPVGDYASGGAVIEFRDVTEEKRIERERLNAILMNEQQSVRIKESEVHKTNMTSFVSFVCHELRNPLQGVTSSAEFLIDTLEKLDSLTNALSSFPFPTLDKPTSSSVDDLADLTLEPETRNQSASAAEPPTLIAIQGLLSYAKELVNNIATCASHQALITNNVLDLSRLDAGKVEPSADVVDLQALGQSIVAMMAARAQAKSINLSLADTCRLPIYLKADATILSQVLLNLVSNATKFTPEHGTITIDLYPDPPDANGQITLHGSVTDNGLGMTDNEQQRLFQRFSQANRKVAQLYGGSGLGLSISKELVRVMGGEMHVKSAQGKGSTFSFTSIHDQPTRKELVDFLRDSGSAKDGLPITDSPILSDATVTKAPPFKMICVAEDNPINLKHLSKHLTILGYAHVTAVNGQEALDKFCAADNAIDAVIIDMSMPVMDGLEATRRMRDFEEAHLNGHRTPIIALSGNALKEQIDDAMSMGTSDYLIKPCKQADLARTLQYWEQIVHTGASHKPLLHTRPA